MTALITHRYWMMTLGLLFPIPAAFTGRSQPPTLAERRADFEAVCAGFAVPHPEGLNIYDTKIANDEIYCGALVPAQR